MSMAIDKYVNRVLRLFWPEDAKGNRRVRFHSQNLREDRHGNPVGLPFEGRSWLNTPRGEWRFEWSLWGARCHFNLRTDGDTGGLTLASAFPPASFWFTAPYNFYEKDYSHRNYFDLSVHDGSLWWQFGGDTMSWSRETPRWKHGNFRFDDFLLGKMEYVEGHPEVHKVKIPMPEGAYDATVEMRDDRWERARWRTLRIRRAKVDVPLGIPFPGKGESGYDCGEDASFGLSCSAETVEEAIGKMVESVLRNRRRYGGNLMKKYPTPEERAEAKKNRPPPDDGGSKAEVSA